MADAGILRLIHANEAGGIFGAHRLASFAALRPNTEIYVFADLIAAIHALDAAWRDNPKLPPLRALVEVGAGRAGARTLAEAKAVAEAIVATDGRLKLAGVATYEGSAARATLGETLQAIAGLMSLAADALALARRPRGAERKAYRHRGRLGLFRPRGRRAETRCRTRRSRAARFAQRLDLLP